MNAERNILVQEELASRLPSLACKDSLSTHLAWDQCQQSVHAHALNALASNENLANVVNGMGRDVGCPANGYSIDNKNI